MKAILYNGNKAVGETNNSRFAIYRAMIQYPEITSGEVLDESGWRFVIRRDLTPKRYLNPKNWENSQLHYEITMY